jgi:hypothetical protein
MRTISTYRKSGRLFILREIAFHEKAGRSQVGSAVFSLDKVLFSPAESAAAAILPSALSMSDFSLGASWAFSFQPVLPPDSRPPVPSLG